jgi:GntR family transcriptional regulator/MocR family aminotransferase
MSHVVMALDRQGNLLTEEAVADLMDSGELRRHIRKTQLVYDARRLAFARNLQAEFGDTLRYQVPDGGLAFWLTSPDPAVLDRIDAGAAAAGVRLAPSHAYSATGSHARGLRLGFASLSEAEAAEGLRRIRTAAFDAPHAARV